MARMVVCKKLGKELEGLDSPPYVDDLGERIFQHISKDAWKMWIEEQTKLINELKLQSFKPEAQKLLKEHAEKFLFS